MDTTHKIQLKDTSDFPEMFFPLAEQMSIALDELRKRDDVQWVYISPAADFQAEGSRTGEYALAGEEFTANAAGASYISYADYAIAVVDEIETGTHNQERISVYQKN
jgi:putative NADH-flavin reductase